MRPWKHSRLVSNLLIVAQCGWEFQDFSVIQILREINFGESRSSKTANFCNFRDCGFFYFGKFQSSKLQKLENQNSEPLNMLKLQILHF